MMRDASNAGGTPDAGLFWQRLADAFQDSGDVVKALGGALLFIVGVLGLAFLAISLVKDGSLLDTGNPHAGRSSRPLG